MILALLGAVGCCVAAEGDEMLVNGHFKHELQNWKFGWADEYRDKMSEPAIFPSKPFPAVKMDVPHTSRFAYIRLGQEIELREGAVYEVAVDLKGPNPESVVLVYCNNDAKPKVNHGLSMKVKLTDQWQRHVFRFKATELSTEHPPNFRLGYGLVEGQVFTRNCSMRELPSTTVVRHKRGDVVTGEAPVSVARERDVEEGPKIAQLAAMQAAFAADEVAAKQQYGGKILIFAGTVDAVLPGKQPGTSVLRLDGKKGLVLTRAKTIPANVLQKLKDALVAGKEPTVQGVAKFYDYRSGAVQLVDAHKLRFK
jgi:hypothetical protein